MRSTLMLALVATTVAVALLLASADASRSRSAAQSVLQVAPSRSASRSHARPLIFASHRPSRGTLELAVVRPDGTGFRRVTRHDGGPVDAPRWTSDGTRIVFYASDEFNGFDYTWRIRADGARRELLPGDEWNPPSPSGGLVHFWDRLYDVKGRRVRTLRLVPVTADDIYAAPPVWSPDGRYLVLNMYTETQKELYTWLMVVPTDGRMARVVTPRRDGRFAHALSWSPDSRRLLISLENARGRDVSYTIARDGTGLKRLGPRLQRPHAWSPDSSTIAYVSPTAIMGIPARGGRARRLVNVRTRGQTSDVAIDWSSRGELVVSDLDGVHVGHVEDRNLRRISSLVGVPDWSPDGRRLVVESGGEISVLRRGGGVGRRLTRWSWDAKPKWSPNADRIAFVRGTRIYATSGAATSSGQVYVMSTNGTGLRLLGRGAQPEWSPVGDRLAFVRTTAVENGPNRHMIAVRHVNGSSRVEISGLDPAWSPDGQQLAFLRHVYDEVREGDWNAYASTLLIVRSDGSEPRELVPQDEWLLANPQWSPDGRSIVTWAWSEDRQLGRVHLVDVGTGTTSVLPGIRSSSFTWSPDSRSLLFNACQGRGGRRAILAIYDVKAQTSRGLASATGEEQCPEFESYAWSPEGRRVGYIRCTPFDVEPEACDVHVVNADGTGHRRLTSTVGVERSLDW